MDAPPFIGTVLTDGSSQGRGRPSGEVGDMKRKIEIEVDMPDGEGDVYITLLTEDATIGETFHAAKHLLKQIVETARKLPDPIEKRFFTDVIVAFDLICSGAELRMLKEKAVRGHGPQLPNMWKDNP